MSNLFLAFLFSFHSFAQIVFLDINDNPAEKKAAISAAKQAGKTIVVYPEDDSMFEIEKAFEILKKNPPPNFIYFRS